jgi:hypothetical protein
MASYLKPEDISDPMLVEITAVEMEKVGGAPRIVLYFKGYDKGLLLTREMAQDMTDYYGPHPLVDYYLAMN